MKTPKLKYETKRYVSVSDWDTFIKKVYGRPYSFQQQEGCQSRGVRPLSVPELSELPEDPNDWEQHEVFDPEKPEACMGVPFDTWIARDPKEPYKGMEYDFQLEFWWKRNFYPHTDMLVQDLVKRGLLKPGEYLIRIDW